MAGDWIKIEHALPHKPEVMQLAELLGVSNDEVVGLLVRFWSWVDQNLSPSCPRVWGTFVSIDRIVGRAEFARGMIQVGWLRLEDGQVEIPNYEHHLSQSAKQRGVAAKKKSRQRQNVSRSKGDICPARTGTKTGPEKRREEKSNSNQCSLQNTGSPETPEASSGSPPEEAANDPVIGTVRCDGDPATWDLRQSDLDWLAKRFPYLDVRQTVNEALAWLEADTGRRKTARGMRRFLSGWCGRQQDRGRGRKDSSHGPRRPDPNQTGRATF